MTQNGGTSGSPSERTRRYNALVDIQFASILDPDLTPGSEDEATEERAAQLENAQSAIGVSIGQQQTHLTSPKTPAAEKAAALDHDDEDGLFEVWQEAQDNTEAHDGGGSAIVRGQSTPVVEKDGLARLPAGVADQYPLPSPSRAVPTKMRIDTPDHRAELRDNLSQARRRRAHSGGFPAEVWRKYINFNLPSLPKASNLLHFSLPSLSLPGIPNEYVRHTTQPRRMRSMYVEVENKRTAVSTCPHPLPDSANTQAAASNPFPGSSTKSMDPIPHRDVSPQRDLNPRVSHEPHPSGLSRPPAPVLRKSNSEGSLLLYQRKSFASSLGDDSRFENVQEQVNSRFKAIKDSWQDANFKLPSLPTMPNFNFGTKDGSFSYGRIGSLPKGSESSHATASKASLLTGFNSSTKGPSARLGKGKDVPASSAGMPSPGLATHPFFTRALQDLTGDIVVLGGYRGSILRSAEPPHRQLWVPIKVGLNLRKVDLELGLNPEDEETEEQRIIPGGMLTHIGPVDIGRRLLKRLGASDNAKRGDLRVHNYGYDWRLSPHLLSRRLVEFLRSLPCNQPGVAPEKRGAIVIAHSLGGLITRHAINQHPALVAGVVYAGVPQTCVNILGPLRNGDDVLLSSRVLTAQVNFTIRTSYALLPVDGKCFFNKYTKEEYPVDFFDINTWSEYRLSPCIAPPLPAPNSGAMLRSATGILSAMTQALPSLPGRKSSLPPKASNTTVYHPPFSPVRDAADVARNAADKIAESGAQSTGMAPQMGSQQTHKSHDANTGTTVTTNSPATAVTIPHDKAVAYLTRTLAEVKKFKLELAHRPEHTAANVYPPIALIYGKSTPTVYGAKVESREAIKRADAYDELAFASGDGVVLARAAMVPEGYSVVRGGVVSSDRGHVTLLGDLEAVGRCLNAVLGARRNGVGLGEGAMGRRKGDGSGEEKGRQKEGKGS
ncbi:uncharacterized protein EI97DRAFT_433089 [Westerdykella ornata]|uniref:Uncharacterized protein n=1 Tax=Westerdykella ornata TaxID=318751 RepID=A0A6A6JJN8_WESOR|nr:uncharacterized protein EI97DRAFT_433089 [Westerdykella ornata]KAF2276860.1 hypothetical protein EI97DRAFT_433089 [Westerdykella ornata]